MAVAIFIKITLFLATIDLFTTENFTKKSIKVIFIKKILAQIIFSFAQLKLFYKNVGLKELRYI